MLGIKVDHALLKGAHSLPVLLVPSLPVLVFEPLDQRARVQLICSVRDDGHTIHSGSELSSLGSKQEI